jgi:MFS family permease
MARLVRRLFVNRNIALVFWGQVVSQAGDSIYQIGLLWLCLDMTGSKSLTGLIASAAFLPYLLFALPGGALADRFPRKAIMISADGARLALVACIPLLYALGAVSILKLALLTFLIGSFSAVFYPARDALLPELATADELPHANALIQTSWQLAVLLGPALAALLLPLVGLRHLFSFDAFTFLVSLAAVAAIRAARPPAPPRPPATPWRAMLDGVRYVAANPLMRVIVLVTALDNLILMGPAIVGVPIYVKEVLKLDVAHYAWVQAALAGGVFVGAPLIAVFGRKLPLGRILLIGVVCDGLTYLPLFFVRTFPATVVTIFFHSFFIPMITVSRATLIQRHAPVELQGRVFSIIQLCVVGGTALSAVSTGLLAEKVPMPWIYLGMALLAAATAIPGFLSTAIRRAR